MSFGPLRLVEDDTAAVRRFGPSPHRVLQPAAAGLRHSRGPDRECSKAACQRADFLATMTVTMKTISSKSRIANSTPNLLRAHSSIVLDGAERAPSRAMLYPVGFKPEDFSKPMIAIASSWSMVTPCNMHLDQLARIAEAGANEAGGKAIIFDTITVS